MTTHMYSFAPLAQHWSETKDWAAKIVSHFGDPDEGVEHGLVLTTRATDPVNAEQRALTYIELNFDDPMDRKVTAIAELEPVDTDLFETTYRVRVSWSHR
jgi:hypothetical protein